MVLYTWILQNMTSMIGARKLMKLTHAPPKVVSIFPWWIDDLAG